jgi:integrase
VSGALRRLTVERSDWQGHVTVPKGGRSRQLPMTQRLTAAPKGARHLRGERILCLPDGSPITRDRVIKPVRGAQRVAGIEEGVHILRHTSCSAFAAALRRTSRGPASVDHVERSTNAASEWTLPTRPEWRS